MANRQCGFTRASSLGPIAGFVREQGGSIARIFREAGLPIRIIEAPQTLVPLKEQFRLLERGARETGDAQFGARLGQAVCMHNLGAYGAWVATAPDLESAIVRAGEGLNTMLQTATELRLARLCGKAHWSLILHEPASEGRYQHELLALCYMLDTLRYYAGPNWSPDLVLTTGARGDSKGALELLYRTPVLAGQRTAAIRFDWETLACPKPYSVAIRHGGAAGGSEPSIPSAEDDLGVIAAVTALSLLDGYPRLDWVAAKLGVTRRSLQRRLSERGATFAQLVERTLRERAETLIAQPDVPLTTIAFELGYSDLAHFSRAFKKWTGMPPSARRPASARS